MLANGASAADVTASILRIVTASGIRDVSATVTFTEISLSHLPGPYAVPFTRMRVVEARTQDFGRLDALENATQRYCTGEISLSEAVEELEAIQQRRQGYPRWLVLSAWGLMGGSAALGLGSGTLVAVAAAISAMVLTVMIEMLGSRRVPDFYIQVCGGFVATIAAIVVQFVDPGVNSSLVVISCLIVLLAGLTSIGAVQDAITGWYLTANGRILETVLLTLGLVVGVQGGILLADRFGSDISVSTSMPVTLASFTVLLIANSLIGLGYAVGTHMPARVLPAAVATSAVAGAITVGLEVAGVQRTWAAGFASCAVGLAAVIFGRRLRTPALLFVMCGVVPLVPGSVIYRGLFGLQNDPDQGMLDLLTAAGIAIALAAGAVFGQFVATALSWRIARAGSAFMPVISAPFSTVRRRRRATSMGRRWNRRQTGPSVDTMTTTKPSDLT